MSLTKSNKRNMRNLKKFMETEDRLNLLRNHNKKLKRMLKNPEISFDDAVNVRLQIIKQGVEIHRLNKQLDSLMS